MKNPFRSVAEEQGLKAVGAWRPNFACEHRERKWLGRSEAKAIPPCTFLGLDRGLRAIPPFQSRWGDAASRRRIIENFKTTNGREKLRNLEFLT